ncbi:Superoxide dismutase [Striga hermonthica]|uniref:superoxide dismutase n=1 Tax=Striga hermonthica TaxID=68872 RepID=A0A9N7NLE9_STRHE|nr:Superoxide dismutase [Striga hermonthica]
MLKYGLTRNGKVTWTRPRPDQERLGQIWPAPFIKGPGWVRHVGKTGQLKKLNPLSLPASPLRVSANCGPSLVSIFSNPAKPTRHRPPLLPLTPSHRLSHHHTVSPLLRNTVPPCRLDVLPTTVSLPDLSYDYGALEPVISAEIMQLHHKRHHQAYITNYNKALEQLDTAISKKDTLTVVKVQSAIKFNGGGHINHSIFWNNLAPVREGGGEPPEGSLGLAVENAFGSLEGLIQKMNAEGAALQGSGWVWLAFDKELKRLSVETTSNQDPLVTKGASLVPLLGIDVWEHAYYLQYKNARPDYLKNIWNVMNWKYAASVLGCRRIEWPWLGARLFVIRVSIITRDLSGSLSLSTVSGLSCCCSGLARVLPGTDRDQPGTNRELFGLYRAACYLQKMSQFQIGLRRANTQLRFDMQLSSGASIHTGLFELENKLEVGWHK